jgi:hypothetical protein
VEYRHTQIGKTAIYVLIWGLLVVLLSAMVSDDGGSAVVAVGIITLVISLVVYLFSRLTVAITVGVVSVSFGFGRPKRTFAIDDITGFRQVRNHWYLGWGIRKIRGGWMYNVWGLDAVELTLKSGKKFRIGTDEAPDLLAALMVHTGFSPDVTG